MEAPHSTAVADPATLLRVRPVRGWKERKGSSLAFQQNELKHRRLGRAHKDVFRSANGSLLIRNSQGGNTRADILGVHTNFLVPVHLFQHVKKYSN